MVIRIDHMNDTNTIPDILAVFSKNQSLSSSEVAELASNKQSLVTVKRQLSSLAKAGYLEQSGGVSRYRIPQHLVYSLLGLEAGGVSRWTHA